MADFEVAMLAFDGRMAISTVGHIRVWRHCAFQVVLSGHSFHQFYQLTLN